MTYETATPHVVKQGAMWVVMLGSVSLFRSLDKRNCLDYIKYSWCGVSSYEGE